MSLEKLQTLGRKQHFKLFLKTIRKLKSIIPMSLVCFTWPYLRKLKDEKWTGGKHSKIRLTDLNAANMYDDILTMFVTGKSNNPRYFKYVKKLSCCYQAQKKVGWIHSSSKSG